MFTIQENILPNHKSFPPRRSKESIISALKCCFLLKSCAMLNKNTYGLYLRCPESFDFCSHLNGEPIPPNKSFNGRSAELISYLNFFESQHELHDKRILLISDSATLNNYLFSTKDVIDENNPNGYNGYVVGYLDMYCFDFLSPVQGINSEHNLVFNIYKLTYVGNPD